MVREVADLLEDLSVAGREELREIGAEIVSERMAGDPQDK
jgi:hypothetical protein